MTDTIITPIKDAAWFRQFYSERKYPDVEKWVRRACAKNDVPYQPPLECLRYEDRPAEFWMVWEEQK